jgi:hypothetical protein
MPVLQTGLSIFSVKVTPLLVTIGTRIAGILSLITFYVIAKKTTSNKLLSICATSALLLNNYFLHISMSIEKVIWGLFFVLLSFYYLIEYERDKKDSSLLLIILSIICAAGARYELSLLLGVPLVFYLFISDQLKGKNIHKYKKIIYIGLIIIAIGAIPLLNFYQATSAHQLKGPNDNFFLDSIDRIYNSLIKERQMSPSMPNVSFLYYLTWPIALLALLIPRLTPKSKKYILAFIIFFILYNIFAIATQTEGLSSPVKYNINFYPAEILIITYMINYLATKRPTLSRKILSAGIFIGIMIFTINVSHDHIFNERLEIPVSEKAQEYFAIRKVSINEECKVIKYNLRYPELDFYKGIQQNNIFINSVAELDRILKEKECYYFLSGYNYHFEIPGVNKTKKEITEYLKTGELNKDCNITTHDIITIKNQSVQLFKIKC